MFGAVRLNGATVTLTGTPAFGVAFAYLTRAGLLSAEVMTFVGSAFVLEQEFSDDWTADGRRGFFHPDEWEFGQTLHQSAIEGRLHAIAGIEHVVSIRMKRFTSPLPAVANIAQLEMGFDEIVLLANDPDHLERGLIRFEIRGGRG